MLEWLRSLLAAPAPDWLQRMPARVLAVDVETTGLENSDRVVSFGGILLTTAPLAQHQFDLKYNHLIFNPGVHNNPAAALVHGYSDWTLEHQERFPEELESICTLIQSADLIVAHNAEFDVSFINRELVSAGKPAITAPSYCTMSEWRRRQMSGSASLNNVAGFFGLSRQSQQHGALEDAWLALMIYLCFCGCPLRFPFSTLNNQNPVNFRAVPPQPPQPAQPWQSLLTADPVKAIAAAKREGRFDEAQAWLLREIDRLEADSRAKNDWPAAPWAYEQLAIIYGQEKRWGDEIAIINRYCSLPGADSLRVSVTVRNLRQRLAKASSRVSEHRRETMAAPSP